MSNCNSYDNIKIVSYSLALPSYTLLLSIHLPYHLSLSLSPPPPIHSGTSITYTRKFMEGLSNMGVTLPLIGLAIFGTHSHHFYLSLILFNASFFLHGFEVAGSTINPTDLVPSFSGILYGMMNTGGSIAGKNNY